MAIGHLLIFGFGYVAGALARTLAPEHWAITATFRQMPAGPGPEGVRMAPFDRLTGEDLATVTHVLCTAPPGEEGDPALAAHRDLLRSKAPSLRWLGYVSTTGVYGDAGGGWVDESSPPAPVHARGARRVAAEADWQAVGREIGAASCIFRLPGIYGPGRSAFDALRAGTARRLVKPGQVFSRAHVDDIAAAIAAAMARTQPLVVNVADDEPAPPQDVITYAAELLGVSPPPETPFEQAKGQLSPMALEFYGANRRIANGLMKRELGVSPRYPSYREGLAMILRGESNRI